MFSVYPLIGTIFERCDIQFTYLKRDWALKKWAKKFIPMPLLFPRTDFDEILTYSDHIVFNSFQQWNQFKDKVKITRKTLNAAFASILSTRKLKSICTILAFHILDSGSHWRILNQTNLKALMDCISTRCASKILIHLRVRLKSSMRSLENTLKK